MKTIIFTFIIAVTLTNALAQTNLVIRTKAGTGSYTSFSLDDIDRMDFAPCGVVDYGSQTYYTIKIGDQCWFAQNLNIGTQISGTISQSENGIIEKYCYDNDPANCITYGGLYQWDEAMQYVTTEGAQGICPSGWHIPTNAELQILSAEVGGSGNALKAVGQGTGSGDGTNTSGFSALLGGGLISTNLFSRLGDRATFWSSTEINILSTAVNLFVNADNNFINYGNDTKDYGYSVRCIKD